MTPGRAVLIGVSGPDGSGKSGTARAIVATVEERGGRSLSIHTFGCVICRRLRHPRSPRGGNGGTGKAGAVLAAAGSLHGLMDAGELALRLTLARLWLESIPAALPGWRVLVTDRSPMDGLVKHGPSPASAVGRAFLMLARRYDAIIWLDAQPDVLAARDEGHGAEVLNRWRHGFECWAARLPRVLRIDTTHLPPQAAAEAVVSGIIDTAATVP